MLNKLDPHSFPTIQQVATSFRRIGRIGFWVQLGLGVISGLVLLFAFADPNFNLKASDLMSRAGLADVIHTLRQGLILNSVGMFLTLLGVEAIVGTLIGKSLAQIQGLALYNASQLIEPLDILVVQANINMIAAEFVGAVMSSWLISRVNHH